MTSITQIGQEKDVKSLISSFIKLIGLNKLSKKVNFKRKSKFNLLWLFSYLLELRFSRHSLFRAGKNKTDRTTHIKTVRNILSDGRINWQKLLCLTAVKLINSLKPVIDKRRRLALIVDDTLMPRAFSKKTELLAKVYDHDKHKYLTGYRGLTLGWSDGNTFLPVNFALMSTKKYQNLLGRKVKTWDQRSLAGKRRSQARRPMNEVTVELIKQAVRLGIAAKYVLFDSWFSSPKMFFQLKQLGLSGLGMIKKSSKIYYVYRHRHYDIKGLYNRLAASKMTKKNGYLYASIVTAHYQDHDFPLKIVFVSKRGSKGKYLVLATTQIKLRPQEIVQLYGRRWQIETYFKTTKQFLALIKSQIQNYDGQCGYIASTAIAYDLLAWQERESSDDKTLGDLFYLMNDSLPDIKFVDALVYLLDELRSTKNLNQKKIEKVIDKFLAQLPQFMQGALKEAA
jgi:hypothetical protein